MGFLGLTGKNTVGAALCAQVATIGLFYGDPQAGGSELAVPEYHRAATPTWATASGYSYNSSVVSWAPPSTSTGDVAYFGLFDGAGNLLGAGQFSAPIHWVPGAPAISLAVGSISLRPE